VFCGVGTGVLLEAQGATTVRAELGLGWRVEREGVVTVVAAAVVGGWLAKCCSGQAETWTSWSEKRGLQLCG
jgi:hypothetical protein